MHKLLPQYTVLTLCIFFLVTCESSPKSASSNDANIEKDDRNKSGVLAPNDTAILFLKAVRSGNLEETKMLLNHDKSILNTQDQSSGETALIIAAKNRDNNMFKFLLESGTNPNTNDNEGYTALIYCIKTSYIPGVELLLQKTGIAVNYQMPRQKETALHIAVQNDDDVAVKMLLAQSDASTAIPDARGDTPFMIAVQRENIAIIKLFKNVRGFDVTKKNSEGIPPLLFAIRKKYPINFIQEILLYKNAIYSTDDKGHNAFDYLEIFYGNTARLRNLLEAAEKRDGQ